MELRAEQAKLLVGIGEGRAATLIGGLVAQITTLIKRYSEQKRFAEVDDYAQWGRAYQHALDELQARSGKACELAEIGRWLHALLIDQAQRGEEYTGWLEELLREIGRMERGERLPADRDPIRLRAGLILATQEIARLRLEQHRDQSGEDFDDEEAVRLGGAEEMAKVMLRVERGEAGV